MSPPFKDILLTKKRREVKEQQEKEEIIKQEEPLDVFLFAFINKTDNAWYEMHLLHIKIL